MTERPPEPRERTPAGRARRRAAEPTPRSARARSVGEVVPEVGRAAFRRFGFVQSAVVSRWGEIVGDRYARVSTPESIRFPAGERKGGTLTLAVDGAHAATMQHVAPAIIERVNRFFGYPAVERVSIRQGVVRVASQARPAAAPVPAGIDLGDSLRAIADPGLRACLEGLARGLGSRTVGIPVLGKVRAGE